MILFLLLFVFWQRVGFCLHLDKERVYYGEHVLINLVSIIIINDILSKCTWSFLLCHQVTHQASTSSAHKCSKIRLCSLDTYNNGKGNPEMRSSYSWLLKTRTEFISGVNCISWHGFCFHQCMWLFQDWMQWPLGLGASNSSKTILHTVYGKVFDSFKMHEIIFILFLTDWSERPRENFRRSVYGDS